MMMMMFPTRKQTKTPTAVAELEAMAKQTGASPARFVDEQQLAEQLTLKIKDLLSRHQYRYSLRQFLAKIHFADLSEVLATNLSTEEVLQCIEAMAPKQSAEVLVSMPRELQRWVLIALAPQKSSRIIRLMPADDAVDVLQELSTEECRAILGEMPVDADTHTIHQLLIEAPDTAAGIMSTNFVALPVDTTVGDAMERIRQAKSNDFIYYIYLIDAEGRLVGTLSLKTLVICTTLETPLQELAIFDVKQVLESYDQELVASVFRKYYNLLALPVVDLNEKLVGLITLDDVLDVIDEESQEDLYRSSGITLEDMDERHLQSGNPLLAVKARLPWLAITLVGQLVVSSIMSMNQDTIREETIAFTFLPLLCGLAGNMGTQSDTITVRAIALGLVSEQNVRAKLLRELSVALMIGGLFGLVLGTESYWRFHQWKLSALLAAYCLVAVCSSALLGMLIPYLIKQKLKWDPAGVGGPFITTTMDLSIYTSYLLLLGLLGKHLH
jgi:magnesium transporter